MNHLTVIIFGASALVLYLPTIFANDSEFGRIISFDNFDHFSASMNRTYHHEHTADRARKAYDENTRHIQEHNEHAQRGKYSFEIRANNMADFSHDAYLKNFVRLRESVHPETHPHDVDHHDHAAQRVGAGLHQYRTGVYTIPRSLDWRRLGFKTPAFNQATCGSCYAFSIATSIAAQVFKRTGRVVPLSVQQMVDCSASFGNAGCQGGSLRATFRYLASTKGLMRMVDYPYASEVQKCHYIPSLAVVNVTSWALLPVKDEKAMVRAIAMAGPIPISINAATRTFQLYSHGIYDDPACSSESVNHAMLAVGYTPEYFILQNWWGEKWGENGYMKIRRGRNMCGLSNYAAYALV